MWNIVSLKGMIYLSFSNFHEDWMKFIIAMKVDSKRAVGWIAEKRGKTLQVYNLVHFATKSVFFLVI